MNGAGFSFAAPGDWHLNVGERRVSASHDDELLQVATFPLLKPYSSALFARVELELRTRIKQLAAQTGGRVSRSATVTAAGIRSHSFDVTVGDHVDEYTFVLRGLREFQLLCRRKASSGDDTCKQLLTTFRTA